MAPLPADNTLRVYITYDNGFGEHVMTLRCIDGAEGAEALAGDIRTAIVQMLPTSGGFVKAEYSSQGSDVRFPIDLAPLAGVGAAGGLPNIARAYYVGLGGKSLVNGRQVKLQFYTPYLNPSNGPRQTAAEIGPSMETVYNAFQDAEPSILAIDGNQIIWRAVLPVRVGLYAQKNP